MSIFNKNENEWSVPASILVGSIIIAISIFMGANKIAGGGSQIGIGGSQSGSDQGSEALREDVEVEGRKDAPTLGRGGLEIIAFSDFQCPFCQSFWKGAYQEIKQKYIDTGKIRFVFRHYPLPFHQNAQKAAEAAECANRQGQFFPYHDLLFANMQSDGTGLDNASLKKYARDLGLDTTSFNQCLDSGATAEIVKKDFEAGNKAGVSGTPTLFINGKEVIGALPFSEFEKVIEGEL